MPATMTIERRVLIDNQGIAKLSSKIEESESGGKKLYAEGKIGHCGIATANGRIYPLSIMGREVDRLQTRISESSIYAAVDHPGDGKSRIRDAGAIIRGLRIESDGTIWGKFQIIEDTDCGRNLAAILRAGGSVGVSSRGLGSTRPAESGQEVVGEDFRLVSFDFVLDPAVSTAYPKFFAEQADDGLAEQLTTDDLRAKFPKLVKSIEEQSLSVASQTTVEAMRAEMEADVEKAIERSRGALREDLKSELYPEVVKELKEDFGAKLVRATADIRRDVEAVVRSEMAADPEVAGAKLALEQIARLVVPFRPPVDVKKVIDEKDGSIQKLEQSIKKLERELESVRDESVQNADHARNLGFRLYVEKKLSGRPDADTIREMVGDIASITNVEDLQQKVESAIRSADKALEEAKIRVRSDLDNNLKIEQKKASIAQRRAERYESQDAELRAQVSRLTERLEQEISAKNATISKQNRLLSEMEERLGRAGQIVEQLEAKSYASTRLAGHPQKKDILGRIERGELRGKKAINQVAQEADYSADEMGAQERVRSYFGKGREFASEHERRAQEVLSETSTGGTPVPNLEGMAISMEEIRALGGGGSRRK